MIGRDWREALAPNPACDVCEGAADLMAWHVARPDSTQRAADAVREPWMFVCAVCCAEYVARFPKRRIMTRATAR